MTRSARAFIDHCFEKYSLKKINDAGCGDLTWIILCESEMDYVGYDDTIRQVALDNAKPGWELVKANIIDHPMRECDVILCKDVMRHHAHEDIQLMLENFKKSGQYLITDYDPRHEAISKTYHQTLPDEAKYGFPGHYTDISVLIGPPLESCMRDGYDDRYYGIWNLWQ
jgi:hypothetical protein